MWLTTYVINRLINIYHNLVAGQIDVGVALGILGALAFDWLEAIIDH
jgi:hypothetical protein